MKRYLAKMRGGAKSPPIVGLVEVFWSWAGGLCGVGVLVSLNDHLLGRGDLTLMISSFGSSAVLVYGAIRSPLAQPRNLIGGHVLSATIGVTAYQMMGESWFASVAAVSFAIAAMLITGTLHPPAGGTALIAVIGSEQIHNLGYLYVLVPTLAGALILVVTGLLINNAIEGRRYPEYWY